MTLYFVGQRGSEPFLAIYDGMTEEQVWAMLNPIGVTGSFVSLEEYQAAYGQQPTALPSESPRT
jgi:hypothetical protein